MLVKGGLVTSTIPCCPVSGGRLMFPVWMGFRNSTSGLHACISQVNNIVPRTVMPGGTYSTSYLAEISLKVSQYDTYRAVTTEFSSRLVSIAFYPWQQNSSDLTYNFYTDPISIWMLLLSENHIIVIAIGDDYRFAFFGLVTKLWLKFQVLFY